MPLAVLVAETLSKIHALNAIDSFAQGQSKGRHYNALKLVVDENQSTHHRRETTYVKFNAANISEKSILLPYWGTWGSAFGSGKL